MVCYSSESEDSKFLLFYVSQEYFMVNFFEYFKRITCHRQTNLSTSTLQLARHLEAVLYCAILYLLCLTSRSASLGLTFSIVTEAVSVPCFWEYVVVLFSMAVVSFDTIHYPVLFITLVRNSVF